MIALTPGMMVVGSEAALPFSPRALDALRAIQAPDEALLYRRDALSNVTAALC